MKKILYLNKDGVLGGSAISLLLLLKSIKNQYKIFVILGKDGPFRKELEKHRIPVQIINFYGWRNLKNIFRNLYAIFNLRLFLRKFKPHIIHSNSYEINPLMVLSASKKITTICHVRDLITYQKARKYLVHKAKIIIAISKAVANNLKPIKNIKVIYNGVDISLALKSKPYLPIRVNKKRNIYVGIIGNCEERKRQEDFIKAGVFLLKKGYRKFFFFLIGNYKTEYCKRLRKEIIMYKEFFYFIPFQKNIYSLIKSLDIVVIASKEEAFGRVAIEAAVCKKPVIATRTGGLTEIIIHRKTGLLFPCYNYRKLAEYILLLAQDKRLRKQIGEYAYKKVNTQFTLSQYIKNITKIYN